MQPESVRPIDFVAVCPATADWFSPPGAAPQPRTRPANQIGGASLSLMPEREEGFSRDYGRRRKFSYAVSDTLTNE